MKPKNRKLGGSDTKFAYALLAPSLILLVLLTAENAAEFDINQ